MRPSTMNELFLKQTAELASGEAYRYKQGGAWIPVTWREYGQLARNLAESFVELGLGRGDKICVLSNTRPEWDIADKAIGLVGGVTVGIYPTVTADQVGYILAHSEARAVVIEDGEQLEKVRQVVQDCPRLEHLVLVEGPAEGELRSYAELVADSPSRSQEHGSTVDELSGAVSPDDPCTYIYTSGTTGTPKGAILTHRNMLTEAEALAKAVQLSPDDTTLTWLPFAHVFQRAASAGGLWAGVPSAYNEGIDQLIANLGEVRPTIFYSVPRIYEKAYAKILSSAEEGGKLKQRIFQWSMAVGRRHSQLRQRNERIPRRLRLRYALARKLVFHKIKMLFGGRIRFIASSGAPIAREILEFFHAADINTCEAYGATETTGAVTLNTPEAMRFGTVGKPLPGIELRFADDGEILVKGPMVFSGYFKESQKTAAALCDDGWYATGDIGQLDSEGYLQITDRKKDLIITSGGKNIAPQHVENLLKRSPYISQALVHGDKRKYLCCLLTLNEEQLRPWAAKRNLDQLSWEELCQHADVQALADDYVRSVNADLPRYETVKRHAIVAQDFTVENGLLTPTLKLKRKEVNALYAELLDSMYD